jgi:hypothetical protein
MAANKAAAQEQLEAAVAARRAAVIAEAQVVRVGRDDLVESLRRDLRAGRFCCRGPVLLPWASRPKSLDIVTLRCIRRYIGL